MDIRYYFLCYRQEALVASHLTPEAFGRYMAVGTQKLTYGIVVFFEVDPDLTSDYFRIEEARRACVPHADGSPKRSKYVSVYRVLEHLPLPVFRKLYLATSDGRVIGLSPASAPAPEEKGPSMFQELCPLHPRVASLLGPADFLRFMTSRENPLSVPRLFVADLLLDRDEQGRIAGYLPYAHPMHIEACLKELEAHGSKPTKTVSRVPHIQAFYRTIRRGFFLGDPTGTLWYPFPGKDQLEGEYASWWRSAQAA